MEYLITLLAAALVELMRVLLLQLAVLAAAVMVALVDTERLLVLLIQVQAVAVIQEPLLVLERVAQASLSLDTQFKEI